MEGVYMGKSFFGKRSWHRKLAVAVTAGSMSGMCIFLVHLLQIMTGMYVDFKGTSDADWLGNITVGTLYRN